MPRLGHGAQLLVDYEDIAAAMEGDAPILSGYGFMAWLQELPGPIK